MSLTGGKNLRGDGCAISRAAALDDPEGHFFDRAALLSKLQSAWRTRAMGVRSIRV